MLQSATSIPKIISGTASAKAISPRKEGRNTQRIDTILIHPIKTYLPQPNIELRDGFGFQIKQFWITWITYEPSQCYKVPPRSPKLYLERAEANSTFSRKKTRNTQRIDSILIHPIKTYVHQPNLELRYRFWIPINQFWITWITHEPSQCYKVPPRSPKLYLERHLRKRHPPERKEETLNG